MSEKIGRDPELWEAGCSKDHVRNTFIIPDLVARISRLCPVRIADVGSGTGYMSRNLASRLPNCHTWSLLENDPNMLRFSANIVGSDKHIGVVSFDIFQPNEIVCNSFDLVFSVFSTLDFGMNQRVASNLVGLLRQGGTLLIYVPDLLEEVSQMCAVMSSLEPLEEYRRGKTDIRKPDRFTKRVEPFVAHRVELCVAQVLAAGTNLRQLNFLERTHDRRLIVLEFERNA